jgi:hypothetical protein
LDSFGLAKEGNFLCCFLVSAGGTVLVVVMEVAESLFLDMGFNFTTEQD